MPCALAMGGAVTFGIDKTVMQAVYEKDIVEMGMDKYYQLDLDADMTSWSRHRCVDSRLSFLGMHAYMPTWSRR